LILQGLFTFFMEIGAFGKNRAVQFVFLSLTVLFWLLAARDWSGSSLVGRIAGFEGIVCGLSAIYLAMAEVLNEARGREVLLIGEVRKTYVWRPAPDVLGCPLFGKGILT
jgi:succinate-acetate transporter protein